MRGWVISLLLHALALAAAIIVLPNSVSELSAPSVIVPIEAIVGDITDIAPIAAPAPLEELAPQPEPEGAPVLADASALTPVAEPIADPIAKPKPKKPEPPKSALSLDQLAKLIDRSAKEPGRKVTQTAPNAAQGERPRAGAGAQTGLSASEIDALRARMVACWRAPIDAADPDRLVVRVRFSLRRDGSLESGPDLLTPINRADRALVVAGENAVRAVRNCAPYDLPQERYDQWREIIFTFDPRQMLAQ